MEIDPADLSCCSLSDRSVDGDLTHASNDLRSTPVLKKTCTNLFSRDFRSWPDVWVAGREGERKVVGGTKGEGLAPPLLFLSFWDLAARNPRVSCSWGMENSWREREKRERNLGERVLYSLA